MGAISEKLVYLNGTKQAIKQAINEDFEVIDNNTTFREYADEISSNNAKYKGLIPKETTNATNTLDISNSSGLDKALVTQYGNTYQETTTGKNLANYNDNINNSVPNLTITTDSDGYIIVNGTKNVGYPTIVNQVEITDILEDGETYTLWQEDITPSGTSGFSKCENRIRAINTQGQYSNVRTLGRHTNRLVVDKTTFLRYFVDVVLPNKAETYNNYKNRFMLLKGSYTDSDLIEYEPYTNGASPNPDYPQEIVNISGSTVINISDNNNHSKNYNIDLPVLCKIGNYKDKIYPSNGKWYFEKNKKKILLDGSESLVYGYSEVLDKVVRIDVRNILINSKAISSNKMLCDKFISVYSDNSDYEHCRNLDSNYIDTVSFYINKSRLSDISSSEKIMESFIELLQNNHIIIEYLLDNAETIEITENNYPTLYNQLNNIKLYEGVNHITMTNESGLDVEFDIEYYKNWKLD